MQITMLETRRGSDDALTVQRFHEGQTYNVSMELGCAFIRKNWATRPLTTTQEQ